jgi:hypothetical protein
MPSPATSEETTDDALLVEEGSYPAVALRNS